MDTRTRDERLRQIYERSAPVVSDTTFTRHVKEATRRRRPKAFKATRPRRRLVLVVLASVAVLVLIGVGILELTTMMSKDESVVVIDDSMSLGIAASPDITAFGSATLTGVKAELWAEIQRIRVGVASGELTFDWSAVEAAQGNLPSDPVVMLDSLERSLLEPDVTAYLRDSAGEATALRSEISDMPSVRMLEFVSKDEVLQRLKEDYADNPEVFEGLTANPLPASLEVWLTDYTQAASFADELRDRPEVEEVTVHTKDDTYWIERLDYLRSLTCPATGVSNTSAPQAKYVAEGAQATPYLNLSEPMPA